MIAKGKVLKAAVVGLGRIGRLHAQVYKTHPHTVLTGVMDVDPIRARAVAEEFSVPWFTNVDQLLSTVDIDVVSIATPEKVRFDPVVACAKAGKKLLLEKPLSPTLEETDRLIGVVSASGIFASVNYLLRADPRFMAARAAVVHGQIGEIRAFIARRRGTSAGAVRYGRSTNLLISTAVHDLDAMLWLGSSEVVRAYAEGSCRSDSPTEDIVFSTLRFESGAVGMLETSWLLPPSQPAPIDVSFHILGTRGAIMLDGADHGFVVLTEDRQVKPDLTHWPSTLGGVGGALKASIDTFLRAVMESTPPPVSLWEARRTEAVAAALAASLRRGEPGAPKHR